MSEEGRQLSHLLGQEMLALAQADLTRLTEVLEEKRRLLANLQASQLDSDTALTLWRQNRQILDACRQVVPDLNLYGRRK
ncbi:MAG: hypothetical protein U0931_37705 [Vulcanimicrobiota bacterium]